MKIGLMGLFESENLGDPLLHEVTKKLIYEIDPSVNLKEIYLNGSERSIFQKVQTKVLTLIIDIIKKFNLKKKYEYILMQKRSNISTRNFFANNLKGVDAIILSGGGLIKFKYEELNYRLVDLIDYCDKNNIPLYFNSVGVEGFDFNDMRFIELRKALNNSIVKGISTRDDFETLQNHYIKDKNKIYDVSDTALWSGYFYNYEKLDNSNIIGIGVVRPSIFKDNFISFSEENLTDFYINLTRELDNQGVNWEFYTNGLKADNDYLIRLLENSEFKSKEIKAELYNELVHLENKKSIS